MIRDVPIGSDLFSSGADVLVNPVNARMHIYLGVAGLAKQFANRYPDLQNTLREACASGSLVPGGIKFWSPPDGSPRYIVNLATKDDPWQDSRYEWVESGLRALRSWSERVGVQTVASPALGAGLGHLDETRVRELAQSIFADSSVTLLWHPRLERKIEVEAARRASVILAKEPSQPSKEVAEKPAVVSTLSASVLARPPQASGDEEVVLRGRNVVRGPGFALIRGLFDTADVRALSTATQQVKEDLPAWRPVMPRSGSPYRYTMTNAGPLKWVSDERGYRYEANTLASGRSMWVPHSYKDAATLALWTAGLDAKVQLQTFLVNEYDRSSRLGKHVDRDEQTTAPVVSISWGAACDFTFENRHFRLEPGDAFIMHGPGRHAVHGVEAIHGDYRVNITARQVQSQDLDIEYRGERLPSVQRIIDARNLSRALPGISKNPINLQILNASDLRNEKSVSGTIKGLDDMVYVGRSKWVSELGLSWEYRLRNQYKVADFGGVSGPSIEAFASHFRDALLDNGERSDAKSIAVAADSLVTRALERGSLSLVCHCAPNMCHSNVILTYVSSELERRGKTTNVSSTNRERMLLYPQITALTPTVDQEPKRSTGR